MTAELYVRRFGDVVLMGVPVETVVDEDGSTTEYHEVVMTPLCAKALASALYHAGNGDTPNQLDAAIAEILDAAQ